MGTQVTHKKQNLVSSSPHSIMADLARSLLSKSEWKTLSYYLDQYEKERIGVEDLVTAMLRLLDTDEKV